VNTYIRAPASAGAGNSLTYDANALGINVTIVDAAAQIEVNASNVLTLNGGFWQTQPAVFTGTASASLSKSGFTITDARQAWTTNAYTYATFVITGGDENVGSAVEITKNSATVLTVLNSAPAVDTTTTYVIEPTPTTDGTHPNSPAAQAISAALTPSMTTIARAGTPIPYRYVAQAQNPFANLLYRN